MAERTWKDEPTWKGEVLPINDNMLEILASGEQLICFRVVPGGGYCDSKSMAREILRLRARLTASDAATSGDCEQ
jgi:hypothetical protein